MTLTTARKARNLSQAGLARVTGLTQAAISFIETGKVFPQAETRRLIEKALGAEVDWVTTRLKGSVTLGTVEGESPEDSMLRALFVYLKSAQASEVKERIEFVKEMVRRFEREMERGRAH